MTKSFEPAAHPVLPGLHRHVPPELFETATDRAIRQAGIDKAAFAATFRPVFDPAVTARIKADSAGLGSLMPPGRSAAYKPKS